MFILGIFSSCNNQAFGNQSQGASFVSVVQQPCKILPLGQLTHSFTKYLLRFHYIPNTIPAVNKTEEEKKKSLLFQGQTETMHVTLKGSFSVADR